MVCRQLGCCFWNRLDRGTTPWWLPDHHNLAMVLLDQCASWSHFTGCTCALYSGKTSHSTTSEVLCRQSQPIGSTRLRPDCFVYSLSALCSPMGRHSICLEPWSYHCTVCAFWHRWPSLAWRRSDCPSGDLLPADCSRSLHHINRNWIIACGLCILPANMVSGNSRQTTPKLRPFADSSIAHRCRFCRGRRFCNV